MSLPRKAFKRLHYPVDTIAQCVRWYLAYSLSLRNLEEMMADAQKAARADKMRIRALERELRRKDRALAETAALLVLQEKLGALRSSEEDE